MHRCAHEIPDFAEVDDFCPVDKRVNIFKWRFATLSCRLGLTAFNVSKVDFESFNFEESSLMMSGANSGLMLRMSILSRRRWVVARDNEGDMQAMCRRILSSGINVRSSATAMLLTRICPTWHVYLCLDSFVESDFE